jgi:hypothetical protein
MFLEEKKRMTARTALAAVLVAGLVAFGCQGVSPTAAEGPQMAPQIPGSASIQGETSTPVAGLSTGPGCYAVSGSIYMEEHPLGAAGTISGDVEGTVLSEFGPIISHGRVKFRPVRYTWWVTGGSVEALVGRTVVFAVDYVGPWNRFPLIRVNVKARVVEGAERGNVTWHGYTDVSAWPEITVNLEYHGVVCP